MRILLRENGMDASHSLMLDGERASLDISQRKRAKPVFFG